MTCRECANGKEFAEGGMWCRRYGMVIRAEHECTLPGAREKENPPVLTTPAEKDGRPFENAQ